MLNQLLNRACIIEARIPGGRDEYNNETDTVVEVETVCELQQRQRTEVSSTGGRTEVSSTEWLLVLPAGTDLSTGDAVVVDGDRYEVIGEPWQARNPRTSQMSHVEATLKRTSGVDPELVGS